MTEPMVNASSEPVKLTPKWRRELRLLRRDGLRKYVRGAWLLHRFRRAVRRLP
jgi:hypothetical protein